MACFGIAALISAISLLFNHAIDYDPEGWIVYAREAFGAAPINTSGFPAWKPLPVILIGPVTLLSRGGGDVYYWLFITRACAVLTVFAAAALAYRFGGRVAAFLAAVFVLLSPYWLEDSTIGRDSSISGALMLGAFLAHDRRWYRTTVLELTGIALLRPEATPLLLVYAIWMWRRRLIAWWFSATALVFIAFMWLIPTIFHTGLSPASISLHSGGGDTAVNTAFPFLTVIKDAAEQAHQVPAVLMVVVILAVAYRWLLPERLRFAGALGDRLVSLWGRSSTEVVIAVTGVVWVLIVAAETQKGYAGNPRYLVPGLVLFFVAGAVAAVRLAGSSRVALAVIASICVIVSGVLYVHPFNTSLFLIRQRVSQVYDMRQEIAALKCSRGYLANNANNAYLAQILGEPLQDTVDWHLPYVHFDGGHYFWFVYCRPPR